VTAEQEPIRILVADASRSTREEIRTVIEKDGGLRICAEAGDAAGAVSFAVRKRPDVCVLDVLLPGGGLSATWEIGARLPQARLLLLTESAEDGDLLAAVRAGAQGYLLKTEGFTDLLAAIHGVWTDEAAMNPRSVARLLRHLRMREPRWRRPAAGRDAQAAAPDSRLTSREWEVLDLLSQRLTTVEIARTLSISTSAVRVHIAAVVRKLGVPDRAAAAAVLRRPDASRPDAGRPDAGRPDAGTGDARRPAAGPDVGKDRSDK